MLTKKLLLFILVLQSFYLVLPAQSNKISPSNESVFYYYKGQKVYFNVTYKKILIGFAEGHSFGEIKALVAAQLKVPGDSVKLTAVKNQYQLKLDKIVNEETGRSAARTLKSNKIILYSRPCIVGINGKLSSYANEFIVKLKPGITVMQLNVLLIEYNCKLVRTYMFDKSTFILSAGAENGYDALKMANVFFESGLFEYAEPDLEIYDAIDRPPNDALYPLQWDHKNTGSVDQYNGVPDADMNVDSAWLVTKGKSTVKIAVLDEGVDTGHEDLKKNLLQGFDCVNLTSNPGDGRPLSPGNGHGTCCAGIIAALADNHIGIAGIAPNCKIIPINLATSSGNFTTYANIAAGIDYAWMNGADVLTDSWGGGSPSNVLDDAIHRAVTQGRGGKGCTVLFSAGNNNSGLSYPALNSEVIAVGGINMCNKRKDINSCDGENWWGASYGTGLGIVAPCVKIPTTDISGNGGYTINNYFNTFNGTSAACPHAAAVAALVLSVNSSLKRNEVITIIENTADKIPGYTFKSAIGYNNGTWNNEIGYGRANAYHAVLAAQSGNFCNAEIAALDATRFCKGDSVKLQVINKDNSAIYKWYQDNNLVYTGKNNLIAKQSGNYKITATYTNGCTATSAAIKISAVQGQATLIADAGKDILLCEPGSGARIGGLPTASAGAAFLNEKRAYSMDWYSNNFYRYSLTNPSEPDIVVKDVVSASDLSSGHFFAGGDFTPFGYYGLTRITNKLVRIDTLNGSKRLVNIIAPNTGEWTGLAWDPQGLQLYALSSFGTQSELYKVDLVTGNAEFAATIPIYSLIWIAFDNNGKLYALSTNERYIYTINKQTGAAMSLPSVADAGLNYAQDADFDPINNNLYLSAFTARQNYVGDLRLANTVTGTVSSIGTIGSTPYNEMDATGIAGYTYKYSWSPANGLSDTHDANPFAKPSKTTTYTLTVTDLCGKQATSKIKVLIGASKPAVKITASKNAICSGETVKLKATSNNNYIYQWYYNNTKINDATNSFYNAKKAGYYKVHISYGLGGCDSTSKAFKLTNCSGKEFDFTDDDAAKSILSAYTIFPNPATNSVTVTLPASTQPSAINVYDMKGRMVLRKNLNGNSASERLNISNFAAGMYRITWQQNEKQYSWNLIKQ